MRKQKVYKKVQTGPRVTTEYQARFHHSRITVATSTFKKKDPHHPQAEPTANVTTIRLAYVSTQRVQKTSKADTQGTQTPDENFTTIYQSDYKAWKSERRKPFRVRHSLSVNDKNTATADARSTEQTQEKEPFEGVSTYSSDFVAHPVQPRTNKIKKVFQTTKELLKESYKPNATSATKHLNETNYVFQQFQVLSLETKLHGGHVEPKNQNTKSDLPTQTGTSKGAAPDSFTREFYRAWNKPESFTSMSWFQEVQAS